MIITIIFFIIIRQVERNCCSCRIIISWLLTLDFKWVLYSYLSKPVVYPISTALLFGNDTNPAHPKHIGSIDPTCNVADVVKGKLGRVAFQQTWWKTVRAVQYTV